LGKSGRKIPTSYRNISKIGTNVESNHEMVAESKVDIQIENKVDGKIDRIGKNARLYNPNNKPMIPIFDPKLALLALRPTKKLN
jgi:hypothetical protein